MICIVVTQFWDPKSFHETHPRAYTMHKWVKPRVEDSSLVPILPLSSLIGQVMALLQLSSSLTFAQLCPELLAAHYLFLSASRLLQWTLRLVGLLRDS
jgi:hypothetical protein